MSGRKARQGKATPCPTPCDRNPYPCPAPPLAPGTKATPAPALPPQSHPLKLIYFYLYSPARLPLFMCPMQYLKDALTAAAIVLIAWLFAVAFLSL
jgi:hypothetical protein